MAQLNVPSMMRALRMTSYTLLLITSLLGCEKEDVSKRDYPRINTLPITEMGSDGTIVTAEVVFRGDFQILEYGFVWSQQPVPIVERSDKYSFTEELNSDAFSYQLRTLEPQTTYFTRAFIRTEDYLVYGQIQEFVSP